MMIMTVNSILAEVWAFFKSLSYRDYFIGVLVVVVAFLSFGLGRLSGLAVNREGVRICGVGEESPASLPKSEAPRAVITPVTAPTLKASAGEAPLNTDPVTEEGYVASKNGTKYHLPWCSGAQRIKEENKIWFKTKAEAQAAGYEPAANCKGI
jgi:hypothetical protein